MKPWLKEVKSGLRLAFIIVGTILTISVLGLGLRLLGAARGKSLVLGIGLVLAVTILLLATVRWWAKWYFAACCLTTFRAVVMGALGRTISVPSIAAPRSVFAEVAGISAVMTFLSYRFVSTKPNWLDSICLVGAVIATLYSVFSNEPIRWIFAAVLLLAVCGAARKFVARGRGRRPVKVV
ncbi:MAG TPA: hypothetical protein VI431_14355 [Candidatus Acidoferrum sp.]